MLQNKKVYNSLLTISIVFLVIIFLTNPKEKIGKNEDSQNLYFSQSCLIERNKLIDYYKENQNIKETEYRVIKSGQNLSLIMFKMGLNNGEIHSISRDINDLDRRYLNLRVGQRYRIIKEGEKVLYVDFFINNNNFYRIDFTNKYSVSQDSVEYNTQYKSIEGEIKNSLYVDGLSAGLTHRQIQEFAQIFAWDIDFSRNIRKGNKFGIIYEERYDGDTVIGRGAIVAAYMKIGRGDFYAIGYKNGGNSLSFYDLEGESVEKAFLKAPVKVERITSTFTRSRYHPILKTNRPHRGVDYGGGLNTPIMVTADGTITRQRKERGYGNVIIVDHGSGYETLYAHLNKFNSNFKVGSSVKQGETIGYMGTTGLSTGVHLHYELRVNGEYEDPLSIDLPNGDLVSDMDSYMEKRDKMLEYWN